MHDPVNAFVSHIQGPMPSHAPSGPLAGLSFAVKDNFDVAGSRTGAGNPDWLATHAPAARTAPVVQMLLNAGAQLVGKTKMDELAFGILGENFHYGTPVNVRAPDRVPGGSSSGSAAAVAARLVNFALGTDTGGSVRVPASFCGIYGIRPTHGRIALEGVVPLAPGFDTVGWFAHDSRVFRRVGRVLLGDGPSSPPPDRLLIADDAFALADDAVRAALQPAIQTVSRRIGPVEHVTLNSNGLAEWFAAFTVLQRREIWAALGGWIEQTNPHFGPGVRERFAHSRSITQPQAEAAEPVRRQARERLNELLAGGTVLGIPSAPSIAPYRDSPLEVQTGSRDRLITLTCIAGLGGLPQVSLPLAEVGGCPVGLSLIGASGADESLLMLTETLGSP